MFVIILLVCLALGAAQLEENDACETEHYKGNCAVSLNCPQLPASMTTMGLTSKDVGHCGFTVIEEIICCPDSVDINATTEKPPEFTTMSSQTIRDMLSALPPDQRKQKLLELIREASGRGGGGGRNATAKS
ncbi:uncharacterized protein LOC128856315 [Anastrepha ludens]|uniref:uncharacterized protein LOC128856315 n=1 Tax=Anastrepha ludens TaxID=28586 RepID=UPI0023AF2231|nr:uncharacterized protein LOC128856315 [Anastrepha ludens]